METRESPDEPPPAVKFPIAPDGYIPNSVIRGRLRALKWAKWGSGTEGGEEFFIGHYVENYKSIRAQRRAKKIKKYNNDNQEEDLKGERWSEQDAGKDEDKDYRNLSALKGEKEDREKAESDITLDRKRSEDTQKELARTNLDSKLLNTAEANYGQASTEEQVEGMTVSPMDFEKTASSEQLDQKLEIKMPKSDSDAKSITLDSDGTDKFQKKQKNMKISREWNTVKIKTSQNFDPESSTKSSSKKIDHLRSKQVFVLKRGPAVPHSELKETTNHTDDKPKSSKHLKLSEANKQQATTEKQDVAKIKEKPIKTDAIFNATAESKSHLPNKQTKAPDLDQKPQPIAPAPKTHVSTPSRDPSQAHVDHKVLGLYKQFKTGKWVLSKSHEKEASTDLHRSKSRWSFSKTETEGLGAADALYQRESVLEAEGVPTRVLGQTGLWQLIINGVSESLDPDKLWKLLQERPKDHQTSSAMGGLITGRPSGFKTSRPHNVKPVNIMSHEGGHSRFNSDIIQGRNARPGTSMDQNSVNTLCLEGHAVCIDGLGRLQDLALQCLDQTTLIWSTEDRSTGSIAGPRRLDFGVVNRESSSQSTIQTGLGGRDYADESHVSIAKRLDPGQSRLDSSSNISHRETRPEVTGSIIDSRTSLKHNSQLKQTGQSSAKAAQEFDEFTNYNYDRRRQSTGGTIRSRSQTLGHEPIAPQFQVDSTSKTDESRSHGSALLQGSMQSMDQPGYVRGPELTYPDLERRGMRFSESPTSLSTTSVGRSTMFTRQTAFQEPSTYKLYGHTQSTVVGLDHAMGYYEAGWKHSGSSKSGVPMENLISSFTESHGFHSVAQAGSEGLGTGLEERRVTKVKSSRQSTQEKPQPTSEIMSGDRTKDLLGLQTVQSMVHTHGFLTSSEPEKFLKALSKSQRNKTKPMPKWRQGLYQLIFLYGFCSPQTAKLLAREQRKQAQSQSTKQQRDNIELYQFLDSVANSVLHERVVRRVQFQDILDQATSDFHCMIPLPSINNFMTLEKYGEAEFGKLLFEWERGDEEDEQMTVVSASVNVYNDG